MKLVKMSLAAAVLLGASAFAIDNVKVSGDAKLYYGTNNMTTTNAVNGNTSKDLFNKNNSAADTAIRLGVTGDLMKGVSFGVTGYAVSTLGLENNLVSSTWTGAHSTNLGTGSNYAQVNDAAWIGEAWLAATLGKTTAKLGRMELDTPFAFSEKWSVVPNTFEAAVLINQDIPDTTLVGAWVGKGNGTNAVSNLDNNASTNEGGTNNTSVLNGAGLAYDGGVVGANGGFVTFAHGGAYAAAVVNNSWKPLTAQAWYYNVDSIADAYWLQGDIACSLLKGVKLGAQYGNMSPKGVLKTYGVTTDSQAYAVKVGYEGVQNLNVSAAYSFTDKDGVLKIANVGTKNLNTAQSKLYTEAYWNYGYVGAAGASSVNVTAEYDVKDIAKVGVYYTGVSGTPTSGVKTEMTEVAVAVSKSIGALDATLAYVNTDTSATGNALNAGKGFDTVLAMLKLNF